MNGKFAIALFRSYTSSKGLELFEVIGTAVLARFDVIDLYCTFGGRNTAQCAFSAGPLQHLEPRATRNRSQPKRRDVSKSLRRAQPWAFAYQEPIVATVFSFLGLFYAWFGLTNLIFSGMAEVSPVSMGMVFLVGGLITSYLWIASFRGPPGFNLTLLFLRIAFVLLAVGLFTGLAIVSVVGGIAAIISSVIAATASFTDLRRRAGLGEVLMVGELARKARERLAEKIPLRATSASRVVIDRLREGAGVFCSSLRRQLLSPLRMCGLLIYLTKFIRLFGRLTPDRRVPLLAKLATVLGLLLLLTPPAIGLDFIPVIGPLDWLLVGYLSLRLFILLCPLRENVPGIAGGGLTS